MDTVLLSLAIAGLLLAIVALLLVFRLRSALREERDLRESAQDMFAKELKALSGTAVGVGRKLAEMAGEVQRLSQTRPTVTEPVDEPPRGDKPYQMAAKLMQRGADIEELMSVCDLTRGEAELLASLHQRQPQDDNSGRY